VLCKFIGMYSDSGNLYKSNDDFRVKHSLLVRNENRLRWQRYLLRKLCDRSVCFANWPRGDHAVLGGYHLFVAACARAFNSVQR